MESPTIFSINTNKKIELKSFAINKTSFIVNALKLQFLNIFAEQLFHFHLQQCHVFRFLFHFFLILLTLSNWKKKASLQFNCFSYFLSSEYIYRWFGVCQKFVGSYFAEVENGIDASEFQCNMFTSRKRLLKQKNNCGGRAEANLIQSNADHGIVKPNWCRICIHIRFLLFPLLLIAVWVKSLCVALVYYPI